jgi:hypothetical protein
MPSDRPRRLPRLCANDDDDDDDDDDEDDEDAMDDECDCGGSEDGW